MSTARLLDHLGEWTAPFETADMITCRAADQHWNHKLFGRVYPGDNAFQAMTLCGKRAMKIPGDGEIDCPHCLEYMAEGDVR